MATLTTTVTPRLRMLRQSPTSAPYDRSAQTTTSTSEPGPSRLPDFSQFVNVDLRAMDLSDDNIYSSDEPRTPQVPTPPTVTRSENPAAVLRALLSRLPAQSRSPTVSRTSSRQNTSERESDYDASERASATPSAAQSSLKNIFGRALQESGNTPRKAQSMIEDMDTSGVEFTPMPEGNRLDLKGKSRSLDGGETETTIARPRTRFKASSQPITKDFLRERFSDLQDDSPTCPRDTPTNLLDQDSEMQNAIQAFDSDADGFTDRSFSPPPTLRRGLTPGVSDPTLTLSVDSTKNRDASHSLHRLPPQSSFTFGHSRNGQLDAMGDEYGSQSMKLTTLDSPGSFSAARPPATPSSPSRSSIRSRHRADNTRSMKSSRQDGNLDEGRSQSVGRNSPTTYRDDIARSTSPLAREHASPRTTPSRNFENSHQQRSTSLHGRSPSPLLSHMPKSHNSSSALRWSTLSMGPSLNGERDEQPSQQDSPSERVKVSISPTLRSGLQLDSPNERPGPSRESSILRLQGSIRSKSSKSRLPGDIPADDLRETDFSSQNDTPEVHFLNPPGDISEGEPRSQVSEQLHGPSPARKPVNGSPSQTEVSTKPQTSFTDAPSTPPRQTRPKSPRVQFKMPSSPKGLPDLPTPSSSDESEEASRWARQATQKTPAGPNISCGLPTPKPPGGWLATPMPRHANTTSSDVDSSTQIRQDRSLKTPSRHMNTSTFKTPKPPGSWLTTPGPVGSSSSTERKSSEETNPGQSGLQTPVASLSKASLLDPKTPGVPGAWMATPTARKSLQKVRFNAETPSKPVLGDGHATPSVDASDQVPQTDLSGMLSRSPRKNRGAGIRILDEFGREQDPHIAQPVDSVRNRSGLRILDARGNEILEEENSTGSEGKDDAGDVPPTRGKLISRIRRGLGDLLDDIDDIDQDDGLLPVDRARMEELNAASMQARQARLQLYGRAKNMRQELGLLSEQELSSQSISSTSKSVRHSYLVIAIVQVVLMVVMYRLCMNRARNFFMNTTSLLPDPSFIPNFAAPMEKEPPRAATLALESKNMREKDFVPPLPLSEESHGKVEDSSDSDTVATNSSDEFNWFEDEDIKAEQQDGVPAKRGRRLWLAFMKLARPIRVLFVSLIGAAIFATPLVVVNTRFRENVAKAQVHVWSLWLTVIWAAGCVTYLLVDMIPRIVIAVTSLFGGQIERLKIQIELTMAVKGWLKLALDIAWAWISLSVIRAFYHPPGTYWTIINRLMQAFFAAGIILFLEKLFLQAVAINFHEKALADRIAENQLGLKALDRLSNAHPISPKKSPYGKRGHRAPGSSGAFDFSSGLRSKQTDEGSPVVKGNETPPMSSSGFFSSKSGEQPKRRKKKMTSVIVDHVGEAIGQVALKNSKFNKQGDFSGVPIHTAILDFDPYFRSTAEAHEAFALFDKDCNGDITKREMREAVQRIYRERKSLIAGLKDVGSIVAKLDAVLLCVAIVIIIFVCLLIFNRSNTLASLVPLATIILGFSFIFGHSAQTLFESLIFIFSTHVFDVGDLVMIDDQVLFVKEFGLFSTTFRRVDGQEVIAPNAILANEKLVHNLRRSKSMWETTTLMVSYDTPMEVIERLRASIVNYVNTNSREWSNCALNIDKMEYQNAIHLIVAMEHRPNWQDWGGRWTRRTAFMRHLRTVLEELDIRYTMPIQPVILPHGGPSAPRMQPPPPGRHTIDSSMLGNAGFYQAGERGRPAGPAFRSGVPSF
ncbi:hypothetical protein NLJ89_g43 [Agrocybe chaxingu]|uniref:EF-hand domain-containing protein n=1 Tax=Agrocybe chaxingu TaxID=84603 RepID=A0A9W8TGV5_9AGAR|nr:hypothetical protein NLJ89_g43 [Agrocybe chaxingu]